MIIRNILCTALLGGFALSAHALELALPVDCTLDKDCFLQNYVDQGKGEDHHNYQCRPLTYDGHKGTDFRMATMNAYGKNIQVLAAADGTVRSMRDGEEDMLNTRPEKQAVDGKECGNGVVIEHEGGWETQYCHLRKGTVRVKAGDSVKTGDVLGEIGLSGNTEFPHLHLSVRNPEGEPVDPFNARAMESGCATADANLWRQEDQSLMLVKETGLLALGIADAPVDVRDVLDGMHTETALSQEAPAIVLWVLFFGLQDGDELSMVLFDPSGDTFVENADTITGFKAQYIQFIGKRMRDGTPWPPGTYEGAVALNRDGQTLFNQNIRFTVGHISP